MDSTTDAKERLDSKRAPGFAGDDTIEITIAPNAGACFGVVRAIKLGKQALERRQDDPVYSFGPLIHNPTVVRELAANGLDTVESADDVQGGTVVLRSHGVRKEIEADLKARGVQIVDATCPLVKKPQRIATSLAEKGLFLVLVGDANHPEVKGVVSYYGKPDFLVTYKAEAIATIPAGVKRVGVIAQTTIEAKVLEAVVDACRARFEEVQVFNTICDATSVRQREANALAERADVMVVVGGRNSSNTAKLVKICEQHQTETHLIEELDEIDARWFDGKRKIGVTGGASTPMDFVDKVGDYIAVLLSGAAPSPEA